MIRKWAGLAVTTFACVIAGCSKNGITDSDEFKALNADQQQVVRTMDTHGCFECHILYGIGKNKELDGLGAKRKAVWIEQKIRNPKQFNANTKMPAINMPDADRKAIAQHLASLK